MIKFSDKKQKTPSCPKTHKRILLIGNPNVGKSVFFSELTGIGVVSSNYSGTTVNYMEGAFKANENYTLIDVPGTYSLSPTSQAEEVAVNLVKKGADAIICVLDATNLERNLCLALELQQCHIPTVYALNMTDVAERNGIKVSAKLLEQELKAPVIATVAVKKHGIKEVEEEVKKLFKQTQEADVSCGHCSCCPSNVECCRGVTIWSHAKEITRKVSKKDKLKPNFLDKLGESTVKPFPGLAIALLVLATLLVVVRFGGGGLRAPLTMLTDGLIIPFFRNLFENIFSFFVSQGGHLCYRYLYYDEGFVSGIKTVIDGGVAICGPACVFLNVLIGEYGVFVISFQWIIALILPYVFAFYVAVSFLEDSGYLPRVSVLFDNVMRKLGVQGGSLIHVFLALGCAAPAIIGSRAATTRKERLVIAIIICFTVPCIAQIGALIALMSAFSWWMSPLMLLFAVFLFVVSAFIAGKIIKGKVDSLIIEVPNLLLPEPKAYFKKLKIRMKHFMLDAELPMLAAVFLAALLAGTGVIGIIAENYYVQSVVSRWLGMPKEAVSALILGIVRREMSVAPLLVLNLSHLQVFVAGVVSLMYLPCLSVMGILAKEFNIKVAVIIFFATVFSAIFVGGLVNQIAGVFIN